MDDLTPDQQTALGLAVEIEGHNEAGGERPQYTFDNDTGDVIDVQQRQKEQVRDDADRRKTAKEATTQIAMVLFILLFMMLAKRLGDFWEIDRDEGLLLGEAVAEVVDYYASMQVGPVGGLIAAAGVVATPRLLQTWEIAKAQRAAQEAEVEQ